MENNYFTEKANSNKLRKKLNLELKNLENEKIQLNKDFIQQEYSNKHKI